MADTQALPAENPLSDREMDVAQLLVTGASNGEIARDLVISPHTVKVHLRNIYEKLQVSSRTEASMLLIKQGWISVPGVETSAPDESAPPEPEPLPDSPGHLFAWQRPYLAAALLVCLLALLVPTFGGRVRTVANLLSDRQVTTLGQPTVEDLPRWASRTPLPKPRSRFELVAVGHQLYAIGGETTQGALLSDVDAYDLSVNEWRSVSPLPIALANLAATVQGDSIYVAGGSTYTVDQTLQISDRFWVYNVKTDAWQQLGQLPAPLAGSALVAVGKTFYLFGGWDGESMHDEVWRLVPEEAEGVAASDWEVVAHLDSPHAFMGAVAVDDVIYVVGGYDGQRELDSARRFVTARNQWQELPPLSTPRGGLSLLYDGLAVFAVGGGWTQPVATHERFDPATGLWSNFPSPITGEWRHLGAASENGRLHLIGGWSGSTLSLHLQYQSSFRTFLPINKNE